MSESKLRKLSTDFAEKLSRCATHRKAFILKAERGRIMLIFIYEILVAKLGRVILGKNWPEQTNNFYILVGVGAIICPMGLIPLILSVVNWINGNTIDFLLAFLAGLVIAAPLFIFTPIIISKRRKLRKSKDSKESNETPSC